MMIKKLIGLALASTATLFLANCGNSDEVGMDTTTMTEGTSNKTGLGGYWWTYVDRTGSSSVVPDTGKVEPLNATSSALKASIAKGAGKGLEDDGTGNYAFHVSGTVAPEPAWTAALGTDPTWADTYWDTHYGSLCVDGLCGEVKYPSAGLGMGFKKGNAPLDADAAGKVGIVFKFKLGTTHPATSGVDVSLPMDITDVPDPSFKDLFGTAYQASPPLHSGAATPTTNSPYCSFPGSKKADGSANGSTKTCFANLNVAITAPTTSWQTYCAPFSSFGHPAWAATALQAAGILEGMVTKDNVSLTPRIIKLQFDAYKPGSTESATVFDFWVDDVLLADDATWAANCAAPAITL